MTRFTVTAWYSASDSRVATVEGFETAIEARADMLIKSGKQGAALVTVNGVTGVLLAYCENNKAPVYVVAAFRSAVMPAVAA